MKRFNLIGLTGQSGAGKSTVARVFADGGAMVINADSIVGELYTPHSPCLKTLAAQFGADILQADGSLNRTLLAERAFSAGENTVLLGQLVHPFVTARLFERLRGASGLVIFDAPQLFEANADVICDSVIAVVAEETLRLRRVMKRDGITREQAQARMNAQYSEEFFRENCDFLIDNNSSDAALIQRAKQLLQQLTAEVR